MKVKYFSWSDLLNTDFENGVIHSFEIHPNLLLAANTLIKVYLDDQSKALTEFAMFKSVIHGILSEHDLVKNSDDAELNDLIVEVEWIVEEPLHDPSEYIEAQLKAYAVLISARLAFLLFGRQHNLRWLDARDIIVTDENWTQSTINFEVSRSKLEQLKDSIAYISTHGIGASPDNQNTLTANPNSWELLNCIVLDSN